MSRLWFAAATGVVTAFVVFGLQQIGPADPGPGSAVRPTLVASLGLSVLGGMAMVVLILWSTWWHLGFDREKK